MKHKRIWLLSVLINMLSCLCVSGQSPHYEDAVLWFRVKPDAREDLVLKAIHDEIPAEYFSAELLFAAHQKTIELSRIYELRFSSEAMAQKALQVLKQLESVAYVEQRPAFFSYYTPNDLLGKQWNLAKINAIDAWDISRGSAQVTVAVVDDFFDLTHPDLSSVWALNTKEIPGNGIDDDRNGYTDDYHGWNAAYNIPHVLPPMARRALFAHGTHCAGIVGAETDNATGIASIGFGVRVLAVAVGDSTTPGKLGNALKGVVYAVDRGAQIVSLSWGTYGYSATGQLVMDYAHNQGSVIMAAAGNDNTDVPVYPAGYNHVIAVTSTDTGDYKSGFSNFGSWVDLSAPGSGILSTFTGQMPPYGEMSGTSMSTPLTSGLAGLMLSHNPKLTATEIENLLKQTAYNHYPLNLKFSGQLGAGRIDAAAAMKAAKKIKASFSENKKDICPKDTIQFHFNGYGTSLSYQWHFPGGNPSSSNGTSPKIIYNNPGTYDVRLIVSDGVRTDTVLRKNHIQVFLPTANLTTDSAVTKGNTFFLKFNFTGKAPWRFKLQMIDSIRWFTAQTTPYYVAQKAIKSGGFKLLRFSDSRCSAEDSDSAKVHVLTPASTGPDSCFVSINKKRVQTLFAYAYGSNGHESPAGLLVLQDSNYLVYGSTTGFGAGGEDLLLTKISRSGQLVWTRTIGRSGFEGGFPIRAKEMSNGDIVIVGASATGTAKYQGTVVRLSSTGALRWRRIYPALSAPDHLRGLTELADGSIIVVGTSGYPSNQSASLIRFEANGTQSWKKMHDFSGIAEHYLDVHSIQNKLYLFGTASRGNGGFSSIMSKATLNGDKIWEYRFETSRGNLLMNAVPSADNSGFACVGYGFTASSSTNSQALISFLDTNGNLLWMKEFGGTGIDRLTGVIRGADNDFYAIGFTLSKDVVAKTMIIRFDKNGNVKWDRIYGSKGVGHYTPDFGGGIALDVNDGLVTASIINESNPDILLLSYNHCGESSCHSEQAAFSFRNLSVSRSNAQTTDLTGNSPSVWTMTLGNHNTSLRKREICPKVNKVVCNLTADFNFTQQCVGDTLQFMNKSRDANGFPLSFFKWIIDDTISIPGIRNLSYYFPKVGKHKVTLLAWSHDDYLCTDTSTAYVHINDSLKVQTTGISGRCIGDTVQLHAQAFCGKPPFRFQWFRNTVKLGDSAVFRVAPSANQWYRVRVTDAGNRSVEDSIFVSVDPACCKLNSVLAASGNPWRCQGDSISFINLSDNDTNTLYAWRYETPVDTSTHTGRTSLSIYAPRPGIYKARLIAQNTSCRPDTAYLNIQVFALPEVFAGKDTLLCTPDTVILGAVDQRYQHSYRWSPTIGLENPDAHHTKAFIVADIRYILRVKSEVTGCINQDTVSLELIEKFRFNLDTSFCAGDSIPLFHKGSATSLWNVGRAANPLWVKQSGNYWLSNSTATNCPRSDTIRVRSIPKPPKPFLNRDTTLCSGKTIIIQPRIDTTNVTARWHDGSRHFKRVFHTPGLKLISISAQGCTRVDTIQIHLKTVPLAPNLRDTLICAGDSMNINLPDSAGVYSWSDAFNGSRRTIKKPGLYKVRLVNFCGFVENEFQLSLYNLDAPKPDLKPIISLCEGSEYIVDLNEPLTSYFWTDKHVGGKRVLKYPGLYIVNARNQCFSTIDSISIKTLNCDCKIFVPNAFTPQGDGNNDVFQVTTDCSWENYELNIYNRWGGKIFSTRDIVTGWNGTYQGAICPDGVYVFTISGTITTSGIRRNYFNSGTVHLLH